MRDVNQVRKRLYSTHELLMIKKIHEDLHQINSLPFEIKVKWLIPHLLKRDQWNVHDKWDSG